MSSGGASESKEEGMSGESQIEWTDATWNLTYGCTKVSPACAHCYIERAPPYRVGGLKFERGNIPVRLMPERLDWPLRWRKPRRIFVESLGDIFHEDVPDEFLDRVFAVMALTPQHTYQVLTKRPERMRKYLSRVMRQQALCEAADKLYNEWDRWPLSRWDPGEGAHPCEASWPLPNVWLGTTVENQRWVDERIPLLLDTPAAVRFLSCEPLLGPLRIRRYLYPDNDPLPAVNWVIIGGESGPRHRPFNLEWAQSIVQQCQAAGCAAFVKQLGGARPGTRLEDLPEELRVREFPQ
jgi:protein gp37